MRSRIDTSEIYTAALAVFAEYGYRKSTVEEIASKINCTKGNLYLYVKDKRELYTRTVNFALRRWQERVRQAIASEKGPRAQLETMCRKAVEYLSRDTELRDIIRRDPDIFPMFPTVDPYEAINARSVKMIASILRKGIRQKVFRPVDADRVSQVIFSMYKMVIIQTYIQNEAGFTQEMFEDTLDIVLNGISLQPPKEVSHGTGGGVSE
jgi:AcrR family transcriptional regulator